MIIGVDVDGVVADLHQAWLTRYNVEFEDNVRTKDVTDWGIHKFVKPEAQKRIYEYLHDPSLYLGVQPIEGALDGIRELHSLGHKIVFISNCNIPMASAKGKWLEYNGFLKHGPLIPIVGGAIRHGFKKLISVDVLIDDYQENLKDIPGAPVLFTNDQTPWNHEWRTFFALKVSGWEDVPPLIKTL